MPAFRALLPVLLVALANTPASAASSGTVRWLVSDFPPYEIETGADRGSGIVDHYIHGLMQRIPEFSYTFDSAGAQRSEALIKEGENVCSPIMLRTPEREKYAVFAERPYLFLLPIRIIATSHAAAEIRSEEKDGAISLPDVLQDGRHHLGVHVGRSFGNVIDLQLAGIRRQSPDAIRTFAQTPGNTSLEKLIENLTAGRADLTLGFSIEVEYFRRRRPELGQLVDFPIQHATELLEVGVSCSRTAMGRQVIDAINRLGGADPLASKARQEYESFLPADELARYRQLMPAPAAQ